MDYFVTCWYLEYLPGPNMQVKYNDQNFYFLFVVNLSRAYAN